MLHFGYYKIFNRFIKITVDNDQVKEITPVGEILEINVTPTIKKVILQIEEYLLGKRKKFDLEFSLSGNQDEKKIYSYVMNLPYGETVTYENALKDLHLKKDKTYLQNVLGKNPFLFLVPTHRIVGENDLGGFRLGKDIKQKLIAIEKSHRDNFIEEDV